jgi:hypothetical protein
MEFVVFFIFTAPIVFFTWSFICIEKTAKQRLELINAAYATSARLRGPVGVLVKTYLDTVSFDAHCNALLFFKDPMKQLKKDLQPYIQQ